MFKKILVLLMGVMTLSTLSAMEDTLPIHPHFNEDGNNILYIGRTEAEGVDLKAHGCLPENFATDQTHFIYVSNAFSQRNQSNNDLEINIYS